MAVFIAKSRVSQTVTLTSGMVTLPQGYSVKVNSNWPYDWNALKSAVERDLGGPIVAMTNSDIWDWQQM